jgi:phage tail sheath protein FI
MLDSVSRSYYKSVSSGLGSPQTLSPEERVAKYVSQETLMPVAPTHPGVFLQEIPSGLRPIVGVATSITAFLGRTVSGPANLPVTITSFAEFSQQFGGKDPNHPLSDVVSDYFVNGGVHAIIVRVVGAMSTTTTTHSDINLGVVNILVAFAPLQPAEFVVLKLNQPAGGTNP